MRSQLQLRKNFLQLRKNPRTVSPLVLVLTFMVGILSGAGGMWGWTQSERKKAHTKWEQAEYRLALSKYALDKLQKITDMRIEIDENITKILDARRRSTEMNTVENGRNKKGMEVQRILKSNTYSLSENVTRLEETLAQLENRAPRTFDFLPQGSNKLPMLRAPQ